MPDHFPGDRKVLCPKCSATRKKPHDPCLSVNGETGMWHCHNCGWSGKLSDGGRTGGSAPAHLPTARRKTGRLGDRPADPRLFLHPRDRRQYAGQGAGLFGLAFPARHRRGDALHRLPHYRDGELLNIKYRDARKNMAQEKDPEPCLWNIDACKKADTIYITEGEIDALTLIECGFPTAVSVDKGAPQPNDSDATKKLECVTNCLEILENAESVVLVTDKDEPGLRLEKELLDRIGPAKCKLVTYPEGCKDINEVLTRCGAAAVIKAITAATPAPVPGLRNMAEFRANIENYYRKGKPRGLTTGYPDFDRYFTFQPGSVNIVTGIPQSGKSEFVHQLVVNAIQLHNWKAAVFSPEMLPVENLFANFAEKLSGRPFFGPAEERMSYQEMEATLTRVDEYIKVILPDADKTPTLDELLAAAQVCVVRYGVKMFVLDPYNEIEHTRTQWMTETEYISYFMARLRKFARQNGVLVFLVAHPTKLKKDERTKKYPVASLYDIAGSANFANKTDNGLSLWRDPTAKSNIVQVHILKIKNKHIGRANTHQEFEWNRKNGRFRIPPPYPETDQPNREV
ncbi:MAG: toprim domain-containing protein [Lentisphaeria bacterium]|nr:MAG: toprim domain-containing protein [Lentisphaeria bacterium]